MIKWIAIPEKEINGVKFGMTRSEVRKVLGIKFREFKKNKFSKNTTDDFGICHVFYDINDQCCAVEVFAECQIFINGNLVFPLDIDSIKKQISDLESEDDGSYISRKYSIGIFAPDGNPETILFGKPGYYNLE